MQWHAMTVHGILTRYLAAGSGFPVVLLHGVGDSAADWQDIVPLLAQNYRVYAPDLPGHGDSTKALPEYTPELMARFVSGFLDVLHIPRVCLVGHSLGGLVSLNVALATPGRIQSLVLMASGGLGQAINPLLSLLTTPFYGEMAVTWGHTPLGRWQRPWLRLPLLFAHPRTMPEWWLREQQRLTSLPGFLSATLATLRAVVDWRGQRRVLLEYLPRLNMPTLVVWGEKDQVLPVSQAREACAHLPQGQIELLADGGHLLPVERSVQCAQILNHFLQVQVV